MIIVVNKVFPEIELELTFTKDEQEHELLQTTKTEISKDMAIKEVKDVNEKQVITQTVNEDEDIMQTLGQLVDSVREKYCGDVTPLETVVKDSKGLETIVLKDTKNIPMFRIGAVDVKVVEDVIGEKPIEDEPIIKEPPKEEDWIIKEITKR